MNTSLSGPHSPVGPGAQKLLSSPSRKIFSGGSSLNVFVQMSYASSSLVCTVATSFEPSNPKTLVRSSQPHSIASFFP